MSHPSPAGAPRATLDSKPLHGSSDTADRPPRAPSPAPPRRP